MNAKHEIMIRAAIAPIGLKNLIQTSEYTAKAIYKEVSKLYKKGFIIKVNRTDTTIIAISNRYEASKTAQLYVTAFIHGVDPKIFDPKSFHQIWQCLNQKGQLTIKHCRKKTNYQYQTILQTFKTLQKNDLVKTICEKPITIKINNHPVNKLLSELHQPRQKETITTSGYPRIKETYATPETIRRHLQENYDITRFHDTIISIMPDQEFLEILYSTPASSPEEIFIRALHTGHGVEQTCVLFLKRKRLNMEKLLDIAKQLDEVNIVGCYLDIIHTLDEKLVSQKTIEKFYNEKNNKKTKVWLKSEKKYGKDNIIISYEKKWNLDIFIDIGAIRHTISGEI